MENIEKSIILMGIKHCGKTTQGRLISQKLRLDFYDTDKVIADREGKSAREIYSLLGKEAFMEAEERACLFIRETVNKNKKALVIATGGGICNNHKALEILKDIGTFVFLKSPENVAADRIMREASVMEDGSIKNLPAYIAVKNPGSLEEARVIFHDFYLERSKIYSELAQVCVDLGCAPKEANTKLILQALNIKD